MMKNLRDTVCCFLLVVCFSVEAENSDQQSLSKGLALIEQQKFNEAEEYFLNLSQAFPQQVSYLNNLAVVQMAQGKTELALENLNTIMAADKFYSVTQKNINDIYAFMASQAYAKALDKKDQETRPQLLTISELMPVVENAGLVEEAMPVTESDSNVIDINDETLLKDKTQNWATAWMNGDVQQYLAHYSEQFKPADGLAYKEWLSQRRYRLRHSKQVEVSYNQLKIYFGSENKTAIVEFIQHYSAGNYQDTVKKQLYWQRSDNDWLIVQEQVTEKI